MPFATLMWTNTCVARLARVSGGDSAHSIPTKRSAFDPLLRSALPAIRSQTVYTFLRRHFSGRRAADPPSGPHLHHVHQYQVNTNARGKPERWCSPGTDEH